MKIVIQCAATKNPTPYGYGVRATDNRQVKFVAHPEFSPHSQTDLYVNPDDNYKNGTTWREYIIKYNQTSRADNPLRLLPAYKLYKNDTYTGLVKKFGIENVFILSAGWGIISSTFLTPDYDITFSNAKNVEKHSHRNHSDKFSDISQLPDDGDSIIFIGGKDYQPLFKKLTEKPKGTKKIIFNSSNKPKPIQGFYFEKFDTDQRTNWHYSYAQKLISGELLP